MQISSTSRELAGMCDFATAYGPNLRGFYRYDCRRVAVERSELDLEGFSVAVHVDHGADVACFERLFRNGFCKDDSLKFVDHVLIPREDKPSQDAAHRPSVQQSR